MADGKKEYLNIGRAEDLNNVWSRMLYRFFEMVPGLLVWGTFVFIVIGSWLLPFWMAIFVILFDLYWLLKTVYFSMHLRKAFNLMREYIGTDWLKKLDEINLSSHALGIKDWRREVWHVVILPYYQEGYDVLHNAFSGLLSIEYPRDRLIVVLSGEERAGEDIKKIGEKIQKEFGHQFGDFLLTFHKVQPGELAGKGANETWAAREVKEKIIDIKHIPYEHIIISVFDADTVPSSVYFGRLTYCYLTASNPLRTSYQPIPLFLNNIWEAPALARVIAFSSTFWHMMNQIRPERLTSFSSQAFPFKAIVEIGFWQTNVVSEDSRIFWQGLLNFDGDWRAEPLLVPVSMDANVAESFMGTMKNLYLQQRRWAYGSENIPYILFGFLKNKKIKARTKLYWTFHYLEGFWSWSTNSLIIFFLGWLPVLLGGSVFNVTVVAYNVPRTARLVLTLAMLGIITSVYLSLMLLPARPSVFGRHKYISMALQWILIPFTLIIFGSLPAIDAETHLMFGKYLGFWPTPKVHKGIQKNIF